MIDTRESLRRAGCQTDKNLLADSLLNRASQLSAQKGVNKQSTLQARDLLKLNPDRGQSDRRTDETQAQWAARMRKIYGVVC